MSDDSLALLVLNNATLASIQTTVQSLSSSSGSDTAVDLLVLWNGEDAAIGDAQDSVGAMFNLMLEIDGLAAAAALTSCDTLADVVASATAMDALVTSKSALSRAAASPTALAAIRGSATARPIIEGSAAAIAAIAASPLATIVSLALTGDDSTAQTVKAETGFIVGASAVNNNGSTYWGSTTTGLTIGTAYTTNIYATYAELTGTTAAGITTGDAVPVSRFVSSMTALCSSALNTGLGEQYEGTVYLLVVPC